jgi:hypothetical protein
VNVESAERQHEAGRLRRQAFLWLLVSLALAELTPLYVAFAVPTMNVYLLHPTIFVSQAVPYIVCGLLWLPWKSRAAAAAARVVAAIMLVVTLAFCLPSLVGPWRISGDMVGLGYLLGALILTCFVLSMSFVAAVVIQYRARKRDLNAR